MSGPADEITRPGESAQGTGGSVGPSSERSDAHDAHAPPASRWTAALLTTLLLFPVAGPVFAGFGPWLQRWGVAGLYIAVLVTATAVTAPSRITLLWAVVFALPMLAAVGAVTVDSSPSVLLVSAAGVPLMATTMIFLLRYLMLASIPASARVVGSASVFLLMSHAFAGVYSAVELVSPGSFIDTQTGSPPDLNTLMYLSLVTQTTLGYGDVLPIPALARAVAAFQAATGVFYMAVVVAQFVGRMGEERR